jgi:RNA polymerase sigma-70 factor (ECF subfamily)
MAEAGNSHAGVQDAAWVEAVVTEHEKPLLRYAMRLVNSPVAAQDVVQNVFIKLVQTPQAQTLEPGGLKGWLYRVTHNEAVDWIRRESRLHLLHERQSADPVFGAPAAADDPDPHQERLQLVLAEMRRLRPHEQQVLLLRLQEGLSYSEISAVTGRSEGYVGNILHHAVKKLSGRLARAMMS